MKESQIIQQRIEALEAELATARQSADAAKRAEAANGTIEERREYAVELYRRILFDYDDTGYDVDSDAADGFIEQVIDPEHRKEIAAALSGSAFFGSMPIFRVCNEATLDRIISVLEACIDYIEDNYALDMWLIYDEATHCLTPEYEDEGEDADDDEELF
jgi:hypothetical protein